MFLALNRLFQLLAALTSLSNCERSLSVAKLLVGSPSRSLVDNILRSVALNFAPSEKPYYLPHFCFTAAAVEEHILFIMFCASSLVISGTKIGCIFTTKLGNVSILLSSKS